VETLDLLVMLELGLKEADISIAGPAAPAIATAE